MRRYLVVAHKTLGGDHLIEKVRSCLAEGPCEFHLLVPATAPHDHAFSDGQIEAAANAVLAQGIERFKEAGVDVTGEVGDANPVYAIDTVLRTHSFDEIILSTLPAGPSRWLKMDVPTRVAGQFSLPLTHLVAEREPAG